MAHIPKEPSDFLPGDPTKFEPPLPRFLLDKERVDEIFELEEEVEVINEPTKVGSLVAGKAGKVLSIGAHPYGEKYGKIYLVRFSGGDFWFVPEDLNKIIK